MFQKQLECTTITGNSPVCPACSMNGKIFMSQKIPECFFQSTLDSFYSRLLLPTVISEAEVLNIKDVGEGPELHS